MMADKKELTPLTDPNNAEFILLEDSLDINDLSSENSGIDKASQ